MTSSGSSPTSEERRYQLYVRVRETLGPEPAETLMALLPRVGHAELEAEVVALRQRVAELESALRVMRSLPEGLSTVTG